MVLRRAIPRCGNPECYPSRSGRRVEFYLGCILCRYAFNFGDTERGEVKKWQFATALPKSQVTTYTHKPLMGVISSTDPAGLTTTYEYDTFGRLAKIKDPDGHVIESYEYNYAHKTGKIMNE